VVEGDLVKVEFDDYDINNGSTIPVICVLNNGSDFSVYPYFMFYYRFDGNIEGSIVYTKWNKIKKIIPFLNFLALTEK
jgi:hypothetical protein